MKNSIAVITAVAVLIVSGLALAKMIGVGGSCCSIHQTHDHK